MRRLKCQVGAALGTAFGLLYTTDLDGDEIRKLLAMCCQDVYCFRASRGEEFLRQEWEDETIHDSEEAIVKYGASQYLTGWTDLVDFQIEDRTQSNLTQWALYRVKCGMYRDRTILAIRGTDSKRGVMQDISSIWAGGTVRSAIREITDIARARNPDYVCGHSLGGMLAECVCSHLGTKGMAINAPGPWSPHRAMNLADGDRYGGVPFEIRQTEGDTLGNAICQMGGQDSSHIGKPKWMPGNTHAMMDFIDRHGWRLEPM